MLGAGGHAKVVCCIPGPGFGQVDRGVGDNRAREYLATSMDLSWVSMIHPTAFVHVTVVVGVPAQVVRHTDEAQ